MELEIKPKENKNYILEEYKIKYKPEELTADGIPTIETQLTELKIKDEEQLPKYENNEAIFKREMIQRVKCLCLHKLGYDILYNTSNMNPRERIKLQELMWSYNDVEHSKIIEEFNDIVCSNILDNPKVDLSKMPIYEYRT